MAVHTILSLKVYYAIKGILTFLKDYSTSGVKGINGFIKLKNLTFPAILF
jgi:hypothetical protein